MTRMVITVKDPKELSTIQKLKVICRAILNNYYEDYEHSGGTISVTLK